MVIHSIGYDCEMRPLYCGGNAELGRRVIAGQPVVWPHSFLPVFARCVRIIIHSAKAPKYNAVSAVSGALPSLLSITASAHPIHIAYLPILFSDDMMIYKKARKGYKRPKKA